MSRSWILKAAIAGLCGSIAHILLMYVKSRSGWLPAFRPYEILQDTLNHWVGRDVSPIVPWALSFVNGSAVLGFVFGRIYSWLPGTNGFVKGAVYGVIGWLVMSLVFFPLLGLGLFAIELGLGVRPALFSLAMFSSYSLVLGVVYDVLNRTFRSSPPRSE